MSFIPGDIRTHVLDYYPGETDFAYESDEASRASAGCADIKAGACRMCVLSTCVPVGVDGVVRGEGWGVGGMM